MSFHSSPDPKQSSSQTSASSSPQSRKRDRFLRPSTKKPTLLYRHPPAPQESPRPILASPSTRSPTTIAPPMKANGASPTYRQRWWIPESDQNVNVVVPLSRRKVEPLVLMGKVDTSIHHHNHHHHHRHNHHSKPSSIASDDSNDTEIEPSPGLLYHQFLFGQVNDSDEVSEPDVEPDSLPPPFWARLDPTHDTATRFPSLIPPEIPPKSEARYSSSSGSTNSSKHTTLRSVTSAITIRSSSPFVPTTPSPTVDNSASFMGLDPVVETFTHSVNHPHAPISPSSPSSPSSSSPSSSSASSTTQPERSHSRPKISSASGAAVVASKLSRPFIKIPPPPPTHHSQNKALFALGIASPPKLFFSEEVSSSLGRRLYPNPYTPDDTDEDEHWSFEYHRLLMEHSHKPNVGKYRRLGNPDGTDGTDGVIDNSVFHNGNTFIDNENAPLHRIPLPESANIAFLSSTPKSRRRWHYESVQLRTNRRDTMIREEVSGIGQSKSKQPIPLISLSSPDPILTVPPSSSTNSFVRSIFHHLPQRTKSKGNVNAQPRSSGSLDRNALSFRRRLQSRKKNVVVPLVSSLGGTMDTIAIKQDPIGDNITEKWKQTHETPDCYSLGLESSPLVSPLLPHFLPPTNVSAATSYESVNSINTARRATLVEEVASSSSSSSSSSVYFSPPAAEYIDSDFPATTTTNLQQPVPDSSSVRSSTPISGLLASPASGNTLLYPSSDSESIFLQDTLFEPAKVALILEQLQQINSINMSKFFRSPKEGKSDTLASSAKTVGGKTIGPPQLMSDSLRFGDNQSTVNPTQSTPTNKPLTKDDIGKPTNLATTNTQKLVPREVKEELNPKLPGWGGGVPMQVGPVATGLVQTISGPLDTFQSDGTIPAGPGASRRKKTNPTDGTMTISEAQAWDNEQHSKRR